MRRQQQPIIGITLNDIFKALEDKEVTTKINNLFSHFKPSLYAGSAVDLTNPDNLHRFLKDCVTRDVFGKIKHSNGVEETNEEYKNRVSQPQYNIAQLTANVKLDLDKYGKVHLYMKFGQNKENIWEMSVEETLKIASSIFKQAILDGDNKEKMLFEHVLSYPLVQKEEEKLDQDALALNQILQEFEEKRIELQQYCIEIEMKKLALENELQVLLFQQEEGLNLKENNVVLKNQLKEMQKREQQLKVQLQESARQLEIVKINHQNEQSKLESEIQSIFQAKQKQEQQKLQENYKVQNQQPSTPGNTLMFAGKQILTLAMSDTYGQQGWTMASHRYYDKDKRDNCSTFVCVHKAPATCWEFIFTPVGPYYKIYLIDTSQNRGDYGQNNYALTCHNALTKDRRDQVSIRVFVHQYDQYEGQLWEVISDQESGKYRIALADPNSQFRGWFLTSHRSGDADKRDSESTYLCLHKEKRQSQLWDLKVNC